MGGIYIQSYIYIYIYRERARERGYIYTHAHKHTHTQTHTHTHTCIHMRDVKINVRHGVKQVKESTLRAVE